MTHVPRAERRARVRRRARCSGPSASTTGTRASNPADRNMQQATVNLFADMGAQPATRQSGLVAASARRTPRSRRRRSTSPPATAADGSRITLTGTATDAGGGVVAGRRGLDRRRRDLAPRHRHDALDATRGSCTARRRTTIKVRATDDSGNTQIAGRRRAGRRHLPVLAVGQHRHAGARPTPATRRPVEVGVKFKADTSSAPSPAIRFYKSAANTGVHSGSLWTEGGQRLAQATFSNESSSGWQTVTLRPAGRGPAEHDVRRVLLRARTGTTPRRPSTSTARRPPARTAARSPTRRRCTPSATPARRSTASTATASSQRLPDRLVQGEQLLGRRDVLADAGPRPGRPA